MCKLHALLKADFWLIAFGAIYVFLMGFGWVASNVRIPYGIITIVKALPKTKNHPKT
jgi:hypothetical protein